MRRKLSFHEGWHFQRPGQERVPVTLPHTWNALDGQDGGNDDWRGRALYDKEFPLPALSSREQVYLELTGAAMTADVCLNGQSLCHHEGGYSTFRVNLTQALREKTCWKSGWTMAERDGSIPSGRISPFTGASTGR